jgi:hypothetical protein
LRALVAAELTLVARVHDHAVDPLGVPQVRALQQDLLRVRVKVRVRVGVRVRVRVGGVQGGVIVRVTTPPTIRDQTEIIS